MNKTKFFRYFFFGSWSIAIVDSLIRFFETPAFKAEFRQMNNVFICLGIFLVLLSTFLYFRHIRKPINLTKKGTIKVYFSILDIHEDMFNDKKQLDNLTVLEIVQTNLSMIQQALDSSFSFEEALRIKCRYCFALKELYFFEQAANEIEDTLPYFQKIYSTEGQMFNNVFYEKMISCLVYSHTYMGEFDLAENNLNLLIRHCGDHKKYFENWEKVMNQERNKLR